MTLLPQLLQLSGLLLVTLIGTVRSEECFWPNGTNRNEAYSLLGSGQRPYQPCGGPTKMCCRLGNGSPDVCDPAGTGLCIGPEGTWWRESCTDPTWQDPGCVILFNNGFYPAGDDGKGVQLSGFDAPMTNCSDGSFCLGGHNKTCCGTSDAIKPINGRVVDSATLRTLTTAAPTPTASSQAAATTTLSSGDNSDSQNAQSSGGSSPAGAIAGGVVGGLAVVALSAGAIWFLCWRRRSPSASSGRASGQAPIGTAENGGSMFKYGGAPQTVGQAPSEMTSYYSPGKSGTRIYESGGNNISEAPSSGILPHKVRPHELE